MLSPTMDDKIWFKNNFQKIIMYCIVNMSTEYRLNKLYESNVPAVRNVNNTCDSYKDWYGQIIANLTATNAALNVWYSTWKATYDPDVTDVSLATIYTTDKPLFSQLQAILDDQKSFFDSIKGSRLANADAISFTWGSSTNQEKTLKGKFPFGNVSNLSSDVSLNNILDTATDDDLDTNSYLVRHQYQLGVFNEESILLDLKFGGNDPGDISDLYDRVTSATDGTSIISQNNRIIANLTFNINRCSQIQHMLTYVK